MERILYGIAAIALIVGYFIFQFDRTTTYQSLLDELIPEDETIEKITISLDLSLLKKSAEIVIDDKKLIDQILNQEIELKRYVFKEYDSLDEAIVIKTNEQDYIIGFELTNFTFGKYKYSTTDPVINPVYELIEEADFDYVIDYHKPRSATTFE